MRHMPTVIKKTPEGRDVIRFRFDVNEETPAMRKPALTREARALVVEALGLSDTGSLVVGELAEDFHDCPTGSACGRYLGSEGTVLHVVGASSLVTDRTDPDFVEPTTFDADNVPDGTPGRDELAAPLLTNEAEQLRDQLDAAKREVGRLAGELVTERARADAAELRADEARRDADVLRNVAKSSAKKASARGAKK